MYGLSKYCNLGSGFLTMNSTFEFFDYSKLKPYGNHYVVIKFSLPYAIHLPIDSYDLSMPVVNRGKETKINVQVIIEDAWKNQEKQNYPFKEEGAFVEKVGDTEGDFRYTKALICIPIGSSDKNKPSDMESIWHQIVRTQMYYLDLGIESINRFLDVYRFYTKEYHITSIAGRRRRFDFVFALLYNENSPTDARSNFRVTLMPVNYWGDIYSKLPDVPEDVVSSIRTLLNSQNEIPLAENLILNTYSYLDQGNYRLAIIEAETAFESAIHRHLQNYFGKDSKMFSDIKQLNKKYGFDNLIRSQKIRPAFNGKRFIQGDSEYDDWKQKVAKQRNSLVHGSKPSATKQEGVDAVSAIEEALSFLINRPMTETYKYLKS